MSGTGTYFLDAATADEAVSLFPQRTAGFYETVIRRRGSAGWVFRFTAYDFRGARETVASLNWGDRVAA